MEIGNLKKIKLNLKHPQFEGDIEFRSIALFVGANGVGKTLILKYIWVMGMITCADIVSAQTADLKEVAQFTFDNCFDDQDFDGTIKCKYDKGSVKVTLKEGTITKVKCIIAPEVDTPSPPTFMSKDMRTFDSIKTYLKIRNKIGAIGATQLVPEQMKEMLDFFKLYDITYVERLLIKLKSRVVTPQRFRDFIAGFTGFSTKIHELYYDRVNQDIKFVNDKGVEKSLTTLGAGEQSLVNMAVANTI